MTDSKITSSRLQRRAPVYVRQSTPSQVEDHRESTRRHVAQAYVDAYLDAARIGEDRGGPLFRSCEPGRCDVLQERGMSRVGAVQDYQSPRPEGGAPRRDLRPQLPGDWDHRVPPKRRRPRGRGPDPRARVHLHHASLQSPARGDLARRDRAHPHLSASALTQIILRKHPGAVHASKRTGP